MEVTRPVRRPASPAMAVLEAIGAHLDVEPRELNTPLYDVLDPDALDSLLASGDRVAVTFAYDDHRVTVRKGDPVDVHVESIGKSANPTGGEEEKS